MTIAYKVLTEAEVAALDLGVYDGAPIDRADGYIHLSTAEQLTETVHRHFAGRADLIIAAVDLAPLGKWVRWESSRHGQLFPHLYARLASPMIIARGPLEWNADGTVRPPGPGLVGGPRTG